MSLISLEGLNKVQETKLAAEGTYDLTILSASELIESEATGRPMIKIRIAFTGEPLLQPFVHYLTFPMDGDDDDKKDNMLRGVKRFLTLFHIDFNDGFDSESLLNADALNVRVVRELIDEDREGKKLTEPYEVNRMLIPKFETEEAA